MDDRRLDDWMHWQASRSGRFAWMVLTPARATVGIGALAAIVAGFMPWAEGVAPARGGMEQIFFSGLGGAGDGVLLLLTSLGAGLLTVHRTPATSRIRTVRMLPAILVGLAALTWLNGYRASMLEIAAWQRRGGTGQIAPGLWLALIGIVLMAAGTAILLPEVIRWRRQAGDPTDTMRVGRREVAEVAGGITGVLIGGWAGVVGGIALTGPTLVGTIALGAIFGGLAGAYLGAWLGRTLVDRLAPRQEAAGSTKATDTMGRHGPRP